MIYYIVLTKKMQSIFCGGKYSYCVWWFVWLYYDGL